MHWLATVHDTIVLSGGPQQVKASVTSKTSLCRQSRRPIQIRTSAGNRANKKLSHHPTLKNRGRMPRRRTDPPSSTPSRCHCSRRVANGKQPCDAQGPGDRQPRLGRICVARQSAATVKAPQSSTEGGSTCAFIVLGPIPQPTRTCESEHSVVWGTAGLGKPDPRTGAKDTLQIEEWFLDPRVTPQVWPSPVTGPSNS